MFKALSAWRVARQERSRSKLSEKISRLNRKLRDERAETHRLRNILVDTLHEPVDLQVIHTPEELAHHYGLRHTHVMVDLDGTLAEWAYPDIGEPTAGAREAMEELHARGLQIGIWTARMDDSLYTAKELRVARHKVEMWLRDNNIPYDFIARGKRVAVAYIDDRSVPFYPGAVDPWADAIADLGVIIEREAARK